MNPPEADKRPVELTRIQRWFQAVVTHADGVDAGVGSEEAQKLIQLTPGQLERVITRSRALSAAERLAIYANAYHTRLLECLGEIFPMLKRTLGEDGFEGLAFGYLQEYPSRSYTLNELGRHFARYLEESRPPANEPSAELSSAARTDGPPIEDWPRFLIDLARLEWALYEVFDGPGVERVPLLDADQLLAISAERWPEAKLIPVVCLELLATRFPVNEYYTALRKAKPDEVVPIPAPAESFVALTRRDYVVRRYALSKTQYTLLRALKEQRAVGEAIESILSGAEAAPDEMATMLQLWFRNWTAEGFFQSVSLPQCRR